MRRVGFCLATIVMLVPEARAEGGLPRIHAGEGLLGLFSEFRFGGVAENIGGIESSAVINAELLFVSPIPASLTRDAPRWGRWMLEPRPHVGVSANLGGFTSTGYFGLTWTTLLARDLLRAGDGLRFDLFFGGSVNNGEHEASRRNRRSLGGNLLFRVGGEIGYQFTPSISISLFYDHESNAGLARRNVGLNGLGLRLGIAL